MSRYLEGVFAETSNDSFCKEVSGIISYSEG